MGPGGFRGPGPDRGATMIGTRGATGSHGYGGPPAGGARRQSVRTDGLPSSFVARARVRGAAYRLAVDRVLTWPECKNVRDLGGLPLVGGGTTAFNAIVRGDHPNQLSPAGWASLRDYGIRTIVTLTTDGVDLEQQFVQQPPPKSALRPSQSRISTTMSSSGAGLTAGCGAPRCTGPTR